MADEQTQLQISTKKKQAIVVTDLQTKQMEKIEELTLYLIQMNKRLNELEKENDLLKNEVKELKTTK